MCLERSYLYHSINQLMPPSLLFTDPTLYRLQFLVDDVKRRIVVFLVQEFMCRQSLQTITGQYSFYV